MTRDLAIIVPSRGRPGNAAELVHCWRTTSTGVSDLYFVVDSDDPFLDGYQELVGAEPDRGARLRVQPKPGSMVAALNQAARPLARQKFALAFLGDDHQPRTVGWDEEIVAELRRMGTGIVTGQDGYRTDELPTWVAMTSDIVRALGYMAPPCLRHLYVDNAWLSLGRSLEAFSYLRDVLVEHMHPVAGKADWDDGYVRVNDQKVYRDDQAAYATWVREELARAVRLIRGATVPA